MIPAGVVERVDPDERKVYLRISKDDVKSAPDYDPDRLFSDQRADVDTHYGTSTGDRR
jgi:hypothetical protein